MWRRALAFLLDLTPLFLLAGIQTAADIEDHPAAGLLNLLLILGYFAGMDYRYGGRSESGDGVCASPCLLRPPSPRSFLPGLL